MDRNAMDRTVFTWCDAPLADWIERSLIGFELEVYRADRPDAVYAVPYFFAVIDGRRLATLTDNDCDTWSKMVIKSISTGSRPKEQRYEGRGYTPPIYIVHPRQNATGVAGVKFKRWPTEFSTSPKLFSAWLRNEVETARKTVVVWRLASEAVRARAKANKKKKS